MSKLINAVALIKYKLIRINDTHLNDCEIMHTHAHAHTHTPYITYKHIFQKSSA